MCQVAKAGAVVKIELSNHQAIEIVGAIFDRDVKRAEQLGRTDRTVLEIGMGEAPCPLLT